MSHISEWFRFFDISFPLVLRWLIDSISFRFSLTPKRFLKGKGIVEQQEYFSVIHRRHIHWWQWKWDRDGQCVTPYTWVSIIQLQQQWKCIFAHISCGQNAHERKQNKLLCKLLVHISTLYIIFIERSSVCHVWHGGSVLTTLPEGQRESYHP